MNTTTIEEQLPTKTFVMIKKTDETVPAGRIPWYSPPSIMFGSLEDQHPKGFSELCICDAPMHARYYLFHDSDVAAMKALAAAKVDTYIKGAKNTHFGPDPEWNAFWIIKKNIEKNYAIEMEAWTVEMKWEGFLAWMIYYYLCGRYENRQKMLWEDLQKDFAWSNDPHEQLLLRHVAYMIGSALGNADGD